MCQLRFHGLLSTVRRTIASSGYWGAVWAVLEVRCSAKGVTEWQPWRLIFRCACKQARSPINVVSCFASYELIVEWMLIVWGIWCCAGCLPSAWKIFYREQALNARPRTKALDGPTTARLHIVPSKWLREANYSGEKERNKLVISLAYSDPWSLHSGPAQVLLQT